jgi:hypothetical protein
MVIVMLVVVILVKVVVSIWGSWGSRRIISSVCSLCPIVCMLLLRIIALLRIILLWMSVLTISILIGVCNSLRWWGPYLRGSCSYHWDPHFNISCICTIIKCIRS